VHVHYRIVEEITLNGQWETVGVIAEWPDAPPHLKLRCLLQHTVSRSIWKTIQQRATARHLSLEKYHETLEEYSSCYRIANEIHHIEADSAAEIRQRLREKYVFAPALTPQL